MRKVVLAMLLALAATATTGAEDERERVIDGLRAVLPDIELSRDQVEPSPIPGLWSVRIGSDVVYVDSKGIHLIQGELIHLPSRTNLTDNVRAQARRSALERESDAVLFAGASGAAIAARLTEQGIEAKGSADVVALARNGSVPTLQQVRQAGRDIGEVLATAVSLINPSVIVIGGALSQAGEHLIAGVREVVYQRSLPLATEHLRIVQSRAGEQAGIFGAAFMVIEHALAPGQLEALLSDG
jgi:hypothetical protein